QPDDDELMDAVLLELQVQIGVGTAGAPMLAGDNLARRWHEFGAELGEAVICALLRDFSMHGEKAIAKVRRTQPAAYLKILALLVPREHKVEHSNPIKDLTDEELEAMIEHVKASIEARAQSAKLIEREAVPNLPPPVSAKNS